MAFGYSERMEKRDNQICECGHKRHDHSYHYDNNQCFILGCGCVEFKKAAQQSVQPTWHTSRRKKAASKSKVMVGRTRG